MQIDRTGPREFAVALGAWQASAPTLADALATSVRAAVLDGRLRVGMALPSERAIADSLRISRGTLVAALGALRRDGWIETRHGAGSHLRLPSWVTERTTPWTLDHPVGELELDLTHAVTSAPHDAVAAAIRTAVDTLSPVLLDDGVTGAQDSQLREVIAARYTTEGLQTRPEQILLTNGARAALHLILDELHERPSPVIVESPTYHSALAIVRHHGARVVTLPISENGWDLDGLVARRGAIAYLVPDFHNPTGVLVSSEQRDRIASIAERLGLTLVIDETMRDLDLREPAEAIPRIRGRDVITLGTVSKTVWGGLRVGWIRASLPIVRRLRRNPLAMLVTPSPVVQLVVRDLFASFDEQLSRRRQQLRSQRDHLAAALTDSDAWDFTLPDGGLTIWLRLHGSPARAVAERAHRLGLALADGSQFAADGGSADRLRLPFTAHPDALDRAVEMLRKAL